MKEQKQERWRGAYALILGLLAVGLALTTSITSARWIGTVFPGFFVLSNNVVASVSLSDWSVALHRQMYQHAIVAVNGQPIQTSQELYALVRRFPAGSALTYTVEKDHSPFQMSLQTQDFTVKDYFLLFGAYLFTGLAIAAIGIGVWLLTPRNSASLALLVMSIGLSCFFLTAIDLYSPHWFFRIHVLSEAFIGATFLHLATVFPIDYVHRFRGWAIAAPYLLSLTLGITYEIFLYQPGIYSSIHRICEAYAGISGLPFLLTILWQYCTTSSPLIRQRIRVIFLGFLGAFALPAMLSVFSSLTGGAVAVNYAVFTIVIFPLSLGYAIAKHDLFEIDILLKRTVFYLTLSLTLALLYLAFLSVLDIALRHSPLAQSPLFSLLFTLTAVLLLNPLKDQVQGIVDRIFFRLRYDPKKVLERTSEALASTLRRDDILSFTWRTISDTMGVLRGGILLLTPDKQRYMVVYPSMAEGFSLSVSHPLIPLLQQHRERVFARYQSSPDAAPLAWDVLEPLQAQLLIPLTLKDTLLGVIVLGQKESGRFFSADDRDFLYTLANQSALSLANALSYEEITELNVGLERKVEERTAALARVNLELSDSLAQLKQAYVDLERSQDNLVRAEKMAALGRLAAGIAHEMNTPLGASLTSLKLLQDLVTEYDTALEDPEVTKHDHHDIATEMGQTVRATREWVEKASSHIRSLKLHTRDLQRGQEEEFSVVRVVEDTTLLLAHRLRLSRCRIIPTYLSSTTLHGDPSKLGQVLTNLITNAIDAYHAAAKEEGDIRVEITGDESRVAIRVSDQGCGIAQEHLDKIFDELFTTKPMGEGTGLGLSIARDIITNFFGGTIRVDSQSGRGSSFMVEIPRHHDRAPRLSLQETTPAAFPSLSNWEDGSVLPAA